MKNALVTGVSRGLGLSIAKQLQADGYEIYGTYSHGGMERKNEIEKSISETHLFEVDLTDRGATRAFLLELKGISFHAIVNNAGMYIPEKFDTFEQEKTWDKIFELHVNTPLSIATTLKDQIVRGGVIVNISSIYGAVYGGASALSYATSKGTLVTLTKTLCNQFGSRGVRVVAVAPGMVETDMSAKNGQAVLDAIAKKTPIGRIGKPEEIAHLVSFLVSEKASYINGTTIIADGGYTCSD